VPGRAFYADNADDTTLRLSFTAPSIDAIREGVRRLGVALQAAF
jgi:2-aminoadipate transaminase